MPEASDFDRALASLEADLRRLEAEYNMFFAGRHPRPPWELRGLVADAVRRLDRGAVSNYGQRFRFETLQARFSAFIELWDRSVRAREEGRTGALAAPARSEVFSERTVHSARIADASAEAEAVRELYIQLVAARQEVGQESVPFERFSEIVRSQVESCAQRGGSGVVFQIAVRGRKVAFTARAVTEGPTRESEEAE